MFFPLAVFPTSFSKGFSASPVSNTVPVIEPKQPNILASQGAACNIRSKSTISHRNVTMMKAESFTRVPEIKKCLSFSGKFPVKDRHSYMVT